MSIGSDGEVELELESDRLHEVDLYRFSRRPVKALFEGHGQPVKVSDGGTPVFYVIPAGLYETMTEQIQHTATTNSSTPSNDLKLHNPEVKKKIGN